MMLHYNQAPDELGVSSKAKPYGVDHIEIIGKIGGTAPLVEGDFSLTISGTRTPVQLNYGLDAKGKTAWVMARWVNRRGEGGPWGLIISFILG